MEVVLNINDINYQEIFKNLTLSVEKGKITTIAGSNNCGKSTLVRILDRKIKDNFNINCMGKDIKDYSLEEYSSIMQIVYPNTYSLKENTPLEELKRYNISEEKIDFLQKKLRTLKFLEKVKSKLTEKEVIWTQFIVALARTKEILVIDDLDYYFNRKELEEIYKFLKKWVEKFKTAILLTTTSLDEIFLTDYLYIIKDGEVILSGEPLTILQKDNILNKAGLNVPFMIDLSVKLRDYDLIKDIELEKEKLLDTLWN